MRVINKHKKMTVLCQHLRMSSNIKMFSNITIGIWSKGPPNFEKYLLNEVDQLPCRNTPLGTWVLVQVLLLIYYLTLGNLIYRSQVPSVCIEVI